MHLLICAVFKFNALFHSLYSAVLFAHEWACPIWVCNFSLIKRTTLQQPTQSTH